MNNLKQKKLLIIVIILLIIAIKLTYKYSINKIYIQKYNNKVYEPSLPRKLLFINIQEKYIAHYNYGTSLYQTGEYKEAKEEFTIALKTVPKKKICFVRANLALTEIKLLSEDEDVSIKKIEDIQKILLEDECATENHNGKDEKSQEIYNYLEQIKNNQEQTNTGEDVNGEEQTETEETTIENEEDKINKIKQKNEDANKGRNPANENDYNENSYKDAIW